MCSAFNAAFAKLLWPLVIIIIFTSFARYCCQVTEIDLVKLAEFNTKLTLLFTQNCEFFGAKIEC